MKKWIDIILVMVMASFAITGCNFLDTLQDGSYNEDNYQDYPKIVRGFVDKAYSLRPSGYYSTEFIGTDAASDNAVYRNQSSSMRRFSVGDITITSNPFGTVWTRDYEAINYCNMFLENRRGINTHYLLDPVSDRELAHMLEGDAYALRAWYHYDLLKVFGGIGTDGNLLGVPLRTEVSEAGKLDGNTIRRASYDETVAQILEDCDSAQVYLPFNNRDYPEDPVYSTPIAGSARYRCFDQISLDGLRAMVYLLWASPAFNPTGDITRYRKAAEYAANVIKHKLNVESTFTGGFDPKVAFLWSDLNSPEVVNVSAGMHTSSIEEKLYPQGFGGSAEIVPTQDLVDAFPAANGYPITDSRSGYQASYPYENRDPRLAAAIFFNGSNVLRNTNSELMYKIETAVGDKDAPGLTMTSPTSYYIKKFIYLGWNPYDAVIAKSSSANFFMRWEQMCLIFAEAASKVVSPTDESEFGISPKQALAYLRNRSTADGTPGLGTKGDPYLEECAASSGLFEVLVKNEWRITTCFEGMHYYNLRRWTVNHSDLSAINVAVHGVSINPKSNGVYTYMETTVESKKYPSLWAPIPYLDIRRCPNLVQNEGWENWK